MFVIKSIASTYLKGDKYFRFSVFEDRDEIILKKYVPNIIPIEIGYMVFDFTIKTEIKNPIDAKVKLINKDDKQKSK